MKQTTFNNTNYPTNPNTETMVHISANEKTLSFNHGHKTPHQKNNMKYCKPSHPTSAALKRDALFPKPNAEQINPLSSNLSYTKSMLKNIHHHCVPFAKQAHIDLLHNTSSIANTDTQCCHPCMELWSNPFGGGRAACKME